MPSHRTPGAGGAPSPPVAAASAGTTTVVSGAPPKSQPAMLLGEEVAAQRSCRAAVDLVLATPPEALSFAALDVALNMLMVQGNPSNPEDGAAAQRLTAYAWERVGELQRWPLVRLLKAGVRYRLVTPQQLRAWQESLAAAGGVRSLSPIQVTDMLEAVRLLTLTEPGRQIAAELDPKLLPAALDWIFDADGSQRPGGDELPGAAGESSGGGEGGTAQQGDSGRGSGGKGAAPAGGQPPAVTAGAAAAEARTRGSNGGAPWAAATAEAARESRMAAHFPADQMASSTLAPSQEGGTGTGRRGRAVPGVSKMPLRRLVLLYHAVDTLGLRLAPAQQWRLAVAVGARLQHGEFEEGRVLLVLRVWSSMQSEYMAARFTRGAMDRSPGYPSTWVLETICQKVHVHRETMGAWGLAQFFGSLGYLSFSPRVQILADLVAALQDKLQPGHAREATAALTGLAKLGVDPGEEFCAACMAVVEADGGRDQLLLVQAAWALGVAKRLTPERWRLLLSLRREDGGAAVGEARRPGARATSQQSQARTWLFAYLLAREQAGATQRPPRRSRQQQPRQQDSDEGGSGSDSSSGIEVPGGSTSGQSVVEPLPGSVLRLGVETALALTEAKESHTWPSVCEALAEVVQQLCQGRHSVRQLYRVYDYETGAPLLVDVAVPSLRLAFQVTRRSEFTHNTNTASATVLTRNRLLADWGWTLVTLPTVGYLTDVMVQKQRRWQQRAQQAGQAQQEGQQAEQPEQGLDIDTSPGSDSANSTAEGGAKAAGAVVQRYLGEDAVQLSFSDEEDEPVLGGSSSDGEGEHGRGGAAQPRVNLRPAIWGYLIRQPGLQERLQQQPAQRQAPQRGGSRGRRSGPGRPGGQGRDRRQWEQRRQEGGGKGGTGVQA
ncbi:hypothetical protein N2152v2_008329 [Parachlorella kessleri]